MLTSAFFLAAAASAKITLSLVGEVSPTQTTISASLSIAPPSGQVVKYIPVSDSDRVLFSACALYWDASNYSTPQTFAMRRTFFTPFTNGYGANGGPSKNETFTVGIAGPTPNTPYCHPKSNNLTLTWQPKKAEMLACWGDPHCSNVIPNYINGAPNSWSTIPIIYAPSNRYYYALRQPKRDWDVVVYFSPYIYNGAATVISRVCIRNGNYAVCVNADKTLTYLNPSQRNANSINIQRSNGEWQIMLPSGTAVQLYAQQHEWFYFTVHAQPSDNNMGGFGNVTQIQSNLNKNSQQERDFLTSWVLDQQTAALYNKPNNTDSLSFTTASPPQFKTFDSCPVPSSNSARFALAKRDCQKDKRQLEEYDVSDNVHYFQKEELAPISITKRHSPLAKRVYTAPSNPLVSFKLANCTCSRLYSTSRCNDLKYLDANLYIPDCVFDYQISGKVEAAASAFVYFQSLCETQASSTGRYPLLLAANGFGNNTCPNTCNGNGECLEHGCACKAGFYGLDCSLTAKSFLSC